MERQTVSKTFKDKLKPTPEQKRALAVVARRCRDLSHAAWRERRERGGRAV